MYTVITHRDGEEIARSRKGIDAHVGDQINIGGTLLYVHLRSISLDTENGDHVLYLRVNTEPFFRVTLINAATGEVTLPKDRP